MGQRDEGLLAHHLDILLLDVGVRPEQLSCEVSREPLRRLSANGNLQRDKRAIGHVARTAAWVPDRGGLYFGGLPAPELDGYVLQLCLWRPEDALSPEPWRHLRE